MIDNVLSIKNLSISFREKTKNKKVLHNSSFNLKRGKTLKKAPGKPAITINIAFRKLGLKSIFF